MNPDTDPDQIRQACQAIGNERCSCADHAPLRPCTMVATLARRADALRMPPAAVLRDDEDRKARGALPLDLPYAPPPVRWHVPAKGVDRRQRSLFG